MRLMRKLMLVALAACAVVALSASSAMAGEFEVDDTATGNHATTVAVTLVSV